MSVSNRCCVVRRVKVPVGHHQRHAAKRGVVEDETGEERARAPAEGISHNIQKSSNDGHPSSQHPQPNPIPKPPTISLNKRTGEKQGGRRKGGKERSIGSPARLRKRRGYHTHTHTNCALVVCVHVCTCVHANIRTLTRSTSLHLRLLLLDLRATHHHHHHHHRSANRLSRAKRQHNSVTQESVLGH